MTNEPQPAHNVLLLRGAALWLLVALLLAWCLVGLKADAPALKMLFAGKFTRVLQAHIDFLLMSALLLGFYGARVPLASLTRWAMVIGAFTNSSLFLLMAIFPSLDQPASAGPGAAAFGAYLLFSVVLTSFGFAAAAVTVLRASFRRD
jgi:hypothetical protein